MHAMNPWTRLAAGAALATTVWFAGPRTDATEGGSATVQAVRPADLVLRNAKIVTIDESRPVAEALAVSGDTIAAVGSNQEIQAYVGPRTRVLDLKGALATPGFIDAHVHFTGVGDAARN